MDETGCVELIVLAVRDRRAYCRLADAAETVVFRSPDPRQLVPGEIIAIQPQRRWRYGGESCLSGTVESVRLDARALGLVPLRLWQRDMWNPDEEYWGEEGEPLAEWAEPIVARGPRAAFEMEQIIPGADPDNYENDPILQALDLEHAGDRREARRILMGLLEGDLRCLDAHAHLGNLLFERRPAQAIRHYEAGLRIGELSLGTSVISFDDVLPWGWIDNRPFLRCLHSYALCLWRLGRNDDAAQLFERMLWLNPSDNQGARFLLAPARAGERWEDREW